MWKSGTPTRRSGKETFSGRKVAKENESGIQEIMRRDLKIIPAITMVVSAHRSQPPRFARETFQNLNKMASPPNPFAYFFEEHPQVLEELEKFGIRFCACDVGGETWPGFVLPSRKVIAIACDPEGNGPGALHVFDQE
jgi:hypothetical protein